MNKWIEQALAHQNEGNFKLSAQCCVRALEEDPCDKDVLYLAGILFFSMRNYEKALDVFVQCYSHESQTEEIKTEILTNVLAAYYEPNAEEFKKRYERNVQNLTAYEFNFIKTFLPFDDLPFICIPRNNHSYYIFDKRTKRFEGMLSVKSELEDYSNVAKNECVLAVDVFDPKQLQSLHEQTYQYILHSLKVPIYVLWIDTDQIQIYLQVVDYEQILATKRFVIFPDYKSEPGFVTFFKDHQSLYPTKLVGDERHKDEIESVLKEVAEVRYADYEKKLSQVRELASGYTQEYYRNLFLNSGDDLRILFITCRFTTFVQYSVRDCIAACRELGIKCDLLIEKSDVHRILPSSIVGKIGEFKPNIIFQVDHFKWEYDVLPDGIMYITWVQDPMPHIFSCDSARGVLWSDFILAMTKTFCNHLVKLGYPKEKILHQPMPVNPAVYYKRDLSDIEKERYEADITCISHVGDPEGRLAQFIMDHSGQIDDPRVKQDFARFLKSAYDVTFEKIQKSEQVFSNEDYKLVLEEAAGKSGINYNITEDFAYQFGFYVGNPVHRAIPLTWLAGRGYLLKLWGNEWGSNSLLKRYAMGPAANGDELAKVLSCSKITLGLQHQTTMHPRALEAMACGSLYICKSLPEEYDYDNIRNYFTEGEDFLCFYNRDDLLNKVDYYLKNDEERRRIAENGRKKTIELYTYKKAMQNCLSFIKTCVAKMSRIFGEIDVRSRDHQNSAQGLSKKSVKNR